MDSLFARYGIHCVVDGQYGSTGKGALAAWLAQQASGQDVRFAGTISNAGPNSGHTFYHNGEKHVLKQLPTFAVASALLNDGYDMVFLSAGAIIDPEILIAEAQRYPKIMIFVHPNAAVITTEDKIAERSGSVAAVAGTRSGTGAALARKVLRDPKAVIGHPENAENWIWPDNVKVGFPVGFDWVNHRYFMEVSQGFSLGLNDHRFYPKTTSRECTVMQGISDARIPPKAVTRTYLSLRTYPIRVGNVDGFSSGNYYPDQFETSWEDIGQEPELTTVTQRIRRVFTFSEQQTADAIRANDPDFIFLNFMNYLSEAGQREILEKMERVQRQHRREVPIIGGFGPTSEDIKFLGDF
jgi:adenylosuccinate synthase